MEVYEVRYYSVYENDYFPEGLFSNKKNALELLAKLLNLDYLDVANRDNSFSSLDDNNGYYIEELEVL